MRISDWSSDVCSSDLGARLRGDMDRFRKLLQPAHGRSAMKRSTLAIVPALAAVALLAACNQSAPDIDQYGANPELPDQHRGLLPNIDRTSTRLNSSH